MTRLTRHVTGFTLIELMVTIAVMVIVAAIAAPSFINIVERQQFNQSTRNITTALGDARSRAAMIKNSVAVCPSKIASDNDVTPLKCVTTAFPAVTDSVERQALIDTNRVFIAQIEPKVNILNSGTANMSVVFSPTGTASATAGAVTPAERTFSLCAKGERRNIVMSRLGGVSQTQGTC